MAKNSFSKFRPKCQLTFNHRIVVTRKIVRGSPLHLLWLPKYIFTLWILLQIKLNIFPIRNTPKCVIMKSINMQVISTVVVLTLLLGVTSALKCFQCGEYHDGVGSITPCLNYTAPTSPGFLKDCPRRGQKFCIVSSHLISLLSFTTPFNSHSQWVNNNLSMSNSKNYSTTSPWDNSAWIELSCSRFFIPYLLLQLHRGRCVVLVI